MIDPTEPEGDEPEERLVVDRHQVEGLRSSARTLIVMVLGFGLLLGYSACQADRTDDDQAATDERLDAAIDDLEAQNRRLDAVIQERADEAARAAAVDCVQSHVRYELLSRALQVLADSEAEAAEALAIFPNPACDLGEAQAELAGG